MSFTPYGKVIDYGEIATKGFEELTRAMRNTGDSMGHAAKQVVSLSRSINPKYEIVPLDPSHINWVVDQPQPGKMERRDKYRQAHTPSKPRPLMLRVFPKTIMLRLGRP